MVRLQKILQEAGIASRRKAEELILQGRVKVNGNTVRKLGVKVDEFERIEVDGKEIEKEKKLYILLNKPKGYVSTLQDPKEKKIITSLISGIKERVFPVGRLDKDCEGLLFLTNDGELANILTHPSFQVPKLYEVFFSGYLSEGDIKKLRKGVKLDDGISASAKVEVIGRGRGKTKVKMSIIEGKKREIKRMGKAIGHRVLNLKRLEIGPFKLGTLKPGEYRVLSEKEIEEAKGSLQQFAEREAK